VTPFAIDTLPREPWRNGASWTRTVCAQAVDGQVLWRISVADITSAGAFSQFEGMERTAVMVQGGPLQLSNDAVQLGFAGVGSQVQFPGEWALQCSEPQGPTQLLNIMVRSGRVRVFVRVVENTKFTLSIGDSQLALVLVLVLRGSFQLRSPEGGCHTLQAGQGMHWQALEDGWVAQPLGDDANMVWCRLSY
jgi:environmental stress-induced protein Ves